ncbi:Hypothetical_protein [Hexamita inflata]|uniref:Hypothetical_protein n=1 Tax=Hexamita inflata TaxID=28002 RepID=A0AA86UQM7_9EUKA|nr:Hypothetical protein HINF_LOCUS55485 [Hexamita inflata]
MIFGQSQALTFRDSNIFDIIYFVYSVLAYQLQLPIQTKTFWFQRSIYPQGSIQITQSFQNTFLETEVKLLIIIDVTMLQSTKNRMLSSHSSNTIFTYSTSYWIRLFLLSGMQYSFVLALISMNFCRLSSNSFSESVSRNNFWNTCSSMQILPVCSACGLQNLACISMNSASICMFCSISRHALSTDLNISNCPLMKPSSASFASLFFYCVRQSMYDTGCVIGF